MTQNNDHPYQIKWEDYRKRRNLSFLSLFITLLIALFMGYKAKQFYGDMFNLPIGYFAFFAIGLTAQIILMVWFHFWSCPKCGKRFFVSTFSKRSLVFLDNCHNCQLPKYFGSTYFSK